MADLHAVARQKAKLYGLNPNFFVRQIQAESGFNPNARSPAGALGVAQIMPATAQGWHVDPMNPVAALDAAAKNMAAYVRKYGSYRNALVAYNAGPGRVGKPLYAETAAYIQRILGNSDGGGLQTPQKPKAVTITKTIPGIDRSAERTALIAQYALNDKKPSSLLELAMALPQAQDTPTTKKKVVKKAPASGVPGGSGTFTISGPNPGRLTKPLVAFARKVAGVYGQPLTGSDGSGHSKYTVNGNVSDHYSGNATDIPLTGAALLAAGRAALIAAGMDPKKARKAPGGLYNIGGHQIIFSVSGLQYGGDHTDHLHISV